MAQVKRVWFDQTVSAEEPTSNRSPLDAANTVRETGLLSLATSLLVIQPFMEDMTKTNIKLHDQIQRLQSVIDRLQDENTIPRSIRYKFHLDIPQDSASNDITTLQQKCDESLKAYQAQIKENIIAGRNFEKLGLQKKKERACINFLSNCARMYPIVDHRYTDEYLSAIVFFLVTAVETRSIFNVLSVQEKETELMKWFPDQENFRQSFSTNITAKTLCKELHSHFKKCLLLPIEAYTKAKANQDTLIKLAKINSEATFIDKTEDTIMKVDQEPPVPPETIEKLVDAKVQQATKKLQQQLAKNFTRGANKFSSASSKKKMHPSANSNKPATQKNMNRSNSKGNSPGDNNKGSGAVKPTKTPSGNKSKGSNKNSKQKLNARSKTSGKQSKKRMD